MQKTEVRLSVFHDGQFFTALFERWDEKGYSVARQTFGVEPSPPELWQMVLKDTPEYSRPVASEQPVATMGNPKRKQREAAKAAKEPAFSTKAQMAVQIAHEENKMQARRTGTAERRQREDMLYEMRAQKRKQKHRGH